MRITPEALEVYMASLQPEDDPILLAMEKRGRDEEFPIVDRLVGRVIYLITKLKQPKLIVELGSGFGYSAWWFLRSMNSGKIVLTDLMQGNLNDAKKNLTNVSQDKEVIYSLGNAIETAKAYNNIDILLIDIDKEDYRYAIKQLAPHLAPGALVIADNTLWYGRVAEPNPDETTRGVMEFNEYMASSKDFYITMLPLRDGVMIAMRI